MVQLHRDNFNMRRNRKSKIRRICDMDHSDHHITSSSSADKNIIGLEDLNQELIEEILLRVPLKYRTKLNIISKTWRTSITYLRRSMPLRTSSGLVIFLKNINNKNKNNNLVIHSSTFLELRDQDFVQTATIHSSLSHTYPFLIDSCNGVLLYGTHDNNFWTYYVTTPYFNRPIALPSTHSVSRLVHTSLLLHGSCYDDQFKIMCIFLDHVDFVAETIQCSVFKDCKWMEYEARIVNSYLVKEDGFVRGQCFRPSVYSQKKLYCTWSLCLLIYDDEKGFFKLIRLPKSSKFSRSVHLFQLLWESEGQLHFCAHAADNEGFCIWAYVNDDDKNEFLDYSLMWKFKQFVILEDDLISGWFRKRIQPVAFNEDLQRLYMVVNPGVIASYSFETQKFEKVWSFDEPGNSYLMSNIFPFLLSSTSQNW